MYTRGSAAIAVLAHHTLYLWLLRPVELAERGKLARHRLQALRCLPNWRAGTMPDVEAASAHTVDDYVREAYWASFEGSPRDARAACLSCLEHELHVTAAAVEHADRDARRMHQMLRALRATSKQVTVGDGLEEVWPAETLAEAESKATGADGEGTERDL